MLGPSMKKSIAILVLLAAAYAVYVFVIRSPEKRACARMGELCGFSAGGAEDQRCLDALDAIKSSNASAVSDFATCTSKAESCAGALGCASGVALEVGTGLLKDFFSGLGKFAK
jgi:hypothetical protein